MTRLELLKELYRVLMEVFDGNYFLCMILEYYPGIAGTPPAKSLVQEIQEVIRPFNTFDRWYKSFHPGACEEEVLKARQNMVLRWIAEEEERQRINSENRRTQ